MTKGNFDQADFRKTLGQFATGVTIVTTLDLEQEPVGITCSSFNSLSMDPPLILWSLAKTAFSLPAFEASKYFNVHILCSDQDQLSNNFAKASTDKFKHVKYKKGLGDTPVLEKYAALFECKTKYKYEGGDHIIFVGEVISFTHEETKPLVFHGGSYAGLDSLI